jgi:hypothetical protein
VAINATKVVNRFDFIGFLGRVDFCKKVLHIPQKKTDGFCNGMEMPAKKIQEKYMENLCI